MFQHIKSVARSVFRAVAEDPELGELAKKHSRFFSFIHKRLTPNEKFGLRLTLGAIITAVLSFLFFGVLQDLIGQDPLVQSDLRVINLVQVFRSPTFNNLMLLFTDLGKVQIVAVGVAAVAFSFFLLKRWHALIILILSVVGGEAIVGILKHVIHRPRPPLVHALAPENSYSFPSGHAFVAFSFYGLLTYFAFRAIKNRLLRMLIILVGILLIFGIGFSRIYLGVHWPSDVLAGYALGAAWLAALITALEIRGESDHVKASPYLKSRTVAVLSMSLWVLWGSILVHFFRVHPLRQPSRASGAQVLISDLEIPQDLFSSVPRATEDVTGASLEPINIIVIGRQEKIAPTLEGAGWTPLGPITVKSVWQSFFAAALSQPYPGPTPEPTLFWNDDPSDLSFTRQTRGSLGQDRYHIVFWKAPYSLEGPRVVWFGMVHLDKRIRTRLGTLLTSQTIDPALDAAREILRVDLSDTRNVESTKEFQIVMPTLSGNQPGNQFFTDGRAYIFFLR
jgi:undecaprenyl-diphosphatase